MVNDTCVRDYTNSCPLRIRVLLCRCGSWSNNTRYNVENMIFRATGNVNSFVSCIIHPSANPGRLSNRESNPHTLPPISAFLAVSIRSLRVSTLIPFFPTLHLLMYPKSTLPNLSTSASDPPSLCSSCGVALPSSFYFPYCSFADGLRHHHNNPPDMQSRSYQGGCGSSRHRDDPHCDGCGGCCYSAGRSRPSSRIRVDCGCCDLRGGAVTSSVLPLV